MRSLLIAITAVILIGIFTFSKPVNLTVTSPAFQNNGMIPSKYSCEGDGINPPLNVTNIPPNTVSLAVIMHDPDAPRKGGFTHWVVWNIATDGNIPEKYTGANQGLNGQMENEYKGMCPPAGTHHYHFMVYALDTKLNMSKSTDKAGLEKAMQGHILAKGDLIGLYKKSKTDSTY